MKIKYYDEKDRLHRIDGPAVERSDGTKEWWKNGHRHRIDGPAVERSDGTKEWWINSWFHREDGPAVECSNGRKEWWKNGHRHRIDGPAVERSDGTKEWWIKGEKLSEEEFIKNAIQKQNNSMKIKYYNEKDQLHREDGPAVDTRMEGKSGGRMDIFTELMVLLLMLGWKERVVDKQLVSQGRRTCY